MASAHSYYPAQPRYHQLEISWPQAAGPVQPHSEPEATADGPTVVNVSALEHLSFPILKRLLVPEPRPEAVSYGMFGQQQTGPIVPDREQIAELVREQAIELLSVILDLHDAQEGLRNKTDPRTGRAPRTEAQRSKLEICLHDSVRRLRQTHEDILSVYADAFGEENARLLDEHVQLWAFGGRLEP